MTQKKVTRRLVLILTEDDGVPDDNRTGPRPSRSFDVRCDHCKYWPSLMPLGFGRRCNAVSGFVLSDGRPARVSPDYPHGAYASASLTTLGHYGCSMFEPKEDKA